jgi:hypothetical protein
MLHGALGCAASHALHAPHSACLQLRALVLVEHKPEDGSLAPPTLATVGAAAALGSSVTALIQGHGPAMAAAAGAASQLEGVDQVRDPELQGRQSLRPVIQYQSNTLMYVSLYRACLA